MTTRLLLLVLVAMVTVVGGANTSQSVVNEDDEQQQQQQQQSVSGTHYNCYVVTIFGLKTADCTKLNTKTVPQSLDPDLQVLRLDENLLTFLSDGEFSKYANLQELYLAHNNIDVMLSLALDGLFSLQILDLEANQLTTVPHVALTSVAMSLRLLNLKGNPIRILDKESFSTLTQLEELNLENCWLDAINSETFGRLTRLTEINLVNNELRTLPVNMLTHLPTSLRILRLYRNPWNCNCQLRWLRRWLTQSSTEPVINWDFATNTPTCAGPALIRGVAWRHLSADQFACPSQIVSVVEVSNRSTVTGSSTGVQTAAGMNVSVDCSASGDPEPLISWSRDTLAGSQNSLESPRAVVAVRRVVNDVGESRVVSRLTLLSVRATTDSGDYHCTAENTAGRAEMTFKITIDAGIASAGRTVQRPGDWEEGAWPVDKDLFIGSAFGLLLLICAVILCTVLRVRYLNNKRQQQQQQQHYGSNNNNHANNLSTPSAVKHSDQQVLALTTLLLHEDECSQTSADEQTAHDLDIDLETVAQGQQDSLSRCPLLSSYDDTTDHVTLLQNNIEITDRTDQLNLLSDNANNNNNNNTEYDNDDESMSLSERLSEAAAASDTTDSESRDVNNDHVTNGQTNRRVRAVSFGPNLFISDRDRQSSILSANQQELNCSTAGSQNRFSAGTQQHNNNTCLPHISVLGQPCVMFPRTENMMERLSWRRHSSDHNGLPYNARLGLSGRTGRRLPSAPVSRTTPGLRSLPQRPRSPPPPTRDIRSHRHGNNHRCASVGPCFTNLENGNAPNMATLPRARVQGHLLQHDFN